MPGGAERGGGPDEAAEAEAKLDPSAPAPPESETWRGRAIGAATARKIPLATIFVTVVVAVAVIDVNILAALALWALRTELLYVVTGIFIAVLLSPPTRLLERWGLRRAVATTLVFFIGLVVFVGVVYLFTAPLISAINKFAHQLPQLIKQVEHGKGTLGRLIARLHLQRTVSQNAPKLAGDITKVLKPAQLLSVGSTAITTLFGLVTTAFLSFFILLDGPKLWRGLISLFKPARAERIHYVSVQVTRSVTGFMLGNFLTSLIAGVIVGTTLFVLGVPFPLLLGLWVALVDLLPLVGGLLAGVPTVIVALLHSIPAGIIMLVVFLVYQQIENHALNPLIMSKTVRLSPLWVLLSVLFFASLGGRVGHAVGAFVGALIGIPLGGAFQIIVREIRRGPDAEEPGGPSPPLRGTLAGQGGGDPVS